VSKLAIDTARKNMRDAELAGNTALAGQYKLTLDAATAQAQQIETDLINAERSQAEFDLKVRESEVNIQSTKGETIRSSLTALGALAGDLGVDQLSAMIQGTDISLPEALLLQQATVLQGQVDTAKNDIEAATAQAKLDTVIKELDFIGKPTDVQSFEYYSQLSESGKTAFIELQNANKGSQIVKHEDGSYSSYNPYDQTLTSLPTGTTGEFGNIDNLPETGARTTSSLGGGQVSGYGSDAWSEGLDFVLDGGKGAGITLPFSFEVIDIDDGHSAGEEKSFGNRVKVVDENGREIWFSHMDSISATPGQHAAGTTIGTQGNTGTTLSKRGTPGNDNDFGSHIDITMPKPDGGYYSPEEVASYIGIGQTGGDGLLSADDIDKIAARVSLLPESVSSKEQVSAEIKRLVGVGDQAGLREYVSGVVFEDLGTTGQAAQLARAGLVETGNELKTLMQDYVDNNGDLGIFTGTLVNARNKVAESANPEIQRIGQLMLITLEDFGRAQTGAAIQDFENKKFKQILPTIFDGKELAEAKIDAFARAQELRHTSDLKLKLGSSTYDLVFGEVDFGGLDLIDTVTDQDILGGFDK
jgi:murein DD-endopeptidase MepM/ murein hydrolase activator NlpD